MSAKAYLELYDAYRDRIEALSQPCINACREEAYRSLQAGDIDVFADAYEKDYGLNLLRRRPQGDPYRAFACGVPGIGAHVCFVLNDLYCPPPEPFALPEGVMVCSLAEAADKHPEIVGRYYCSSAASGGTAEAMNRLFASDGLFVYVPRGVRLERPIQLINMTSASDDVMALSHNLIILEEGAEAQVLVCDHAEGERDYFANRLTEVYLGRGARYEHVKVEDSDSKSCNVSTLLLSIAADAEAVSNIITLRNGRTRNTVTADIEGPGASLSLNGLAICSGEQSCDNATFINHRAGNSESRELFKYILDGRAKGDFYGLIKVAEKAQKTTAMQTNRNLCLSSEAVMRTRPQLEIYADDVKCNHGAAIGRMDENALFYMRQRGISPEEARLLLMFAFAKDVLDNIKMPVLRERLETMIDRRLRGESADCHSCGKCPGK